MESNNIIDNIKNALYKNILLSYKELDHPFLKPEDMTLAGFKCINPGSVQCINCDISLSKWEENDNPIAEHIAWSKRCNYIKDIVLYNLSITFLKNNPIPSIEELKLIIPLWAEFKKRYDMVDCLTSYDDNKNKCNKIIRCFSCKSSIQIIKDEEEKDYIYIKHIIISNNKCDYLKLKFGHKICEYVYQKGLPINYIDEGKFKNECFTTNDNLKCKICLINKRKVLCLPCGHINGCGSCYIKLKHCFICKSAISLFASVYVNDNLLCVICNKSLCNIVFYPCNHVSNCNNCYNGFKNCNICNEEILAFSKVIL